MRRTLKAFFCLLCCIPLVFAVASIGRAENVQLKIYKGENRVQTVRVLLTRLSGRDRLDLTLTAPNK